MYWKGLLFFLLGLMLSGVSGLQAQNPSDRQSAITVSPTQITDCSLLHDAVEREICAARQAISTADEALGQAGLSPSMKTHWEQIRKAQLAKVSRLESLDAADRKKMQDLYEKAEQARKAAPTR